MFCELTVMEDTRRPFMMQLIFCLEALAAEILWENIIWMQLNLIYLGIHLQTSTGSFQWIGFWSLPFFLDSSSFKRYRE